MVVSLSKSDEGKTVVHNGEAVGRVTEVRAGTAYVDPNPTLAGALKSKLGWGSTADDVETYPLEDYMVARIVDDEIRLRNNT